MNGNGGLWDWVRGGRPRRHTAWTGAVGTFAALAAILFALPHEPTKSAAIARVDVEADTARRSAVRTRPVDTAQRDAVLAAALDVWSEHAAEGEPLDVVIDGRGREALTDAGVGFEVLVPDIDAVAAAEQERLSDPTAQRPGDWFAEYKDYAAISAYVEGLAAAYPERAHLETIGASLEGRPLYGLRIAGTGSDPVRLAINGGQHAREWIAAMVPVCIAERLLSGYDRDEKLRAFVDQTSLWVVPVVNPDGYEYSWKSDRYWRKNRRGEHGVDLNRNFGVAWGERGASDDPRSPVYHGDHPFSEPESAAMRDLLRRERVEAHVDFHSYSQLLLYPWSFTTKPAPERDRFAAIADRMASAIYATHGVRYAIKAGAGLYPASGTLMDWAYGERDAITFVVELRPKGGSGFVLPPEQIKPTCDESLAALLALGDAIRRDRDR